MLRICFLFITILVANAALSQSVTGSWYGKADVNIGRTSSNYLTELILRQKGDEVEGVFAYYFKDSYQSFFVRGTYDKNSREVHIKNLPVLHYAGSANGIECPMNFMGILLVSQAKSTLNGYFYSNDKYKYTCPELRVSMTIDNAETNQDSILRGTVAGKKIWKPQQEDFVVTDAATNKPVTIAADAVNEKAATQLNAAAEKKLLEKFEKRENVFSKDLVVEGDSIRVSFYDNGDIDGDIISVFLNNNPVLVKQELNTRSLNIYLALDSLKDVNEISMMAENLGKFPPNTALMVVSDGINRYEVYLSSSLTQNAAVRLKRKKKATN
jgi:hypothetical protein